MSSEGGAFWVLRCSPLTLRRFLWGKFAFFVPPMLILGEILVVTTDTLLHVSPFMMASGVRSSCETAEMKSSFFWRFSGLSGSESASALSIPGSISRTSPRFPPDLGV